MLVEREEELLALDEAYSACINGWGQLIVVTGSVACGKTALLHAFVERAVGQGAVLLTATSSRAERGLRFGVLRQLIHSSALPDPVADDLAKALHVASGDAGTLASSREAASAPVAIERSSTPVLEICTALTDLAKDRPVVIGVDDVQFTDRPSLDALLYLQRRIRFARVLLILAEWTLPDPTYDAFRAEVTRQPNTARLLVAPLSPAAVATLLATEFDPPTAQALAPRYHALTGGNPLLIDALMNDYRVARRRGETGADGSEVAVGQEFRHAVIACLHRLGEVVLQVAQRLAVLGDSGHPAVLDQLLDAGPTAAARVVHALESAGLLDRGRFRHPSAKAAVLDTLVPADRAALHLRAAELLHQQDVKVTEVADHLAAADSLGSTVRGSWAVAVLRHAAQQDLIDGHVDLATHRLDLAARGSDNEADLAEVSSLLLRVEWHRKPSAAARHLSFLRMARADGRLPLDDVLDLAKFLLWYGHIDELSTTLAALAASMETEPTNIGHVSLALRWVMFLCPPAAARVPALVVLSSPRVLHSPWSRAVDMLEQLRLDGSRDEIIGAAEHVLRSYRISERTFDLVVSSLVALLYVDAHDQTAYWCEALLADTATRRSHSWQGVFGSIYAAALIRRGELQAAAELATRAYHLLSPQGWGVAIGAPLCVRVAAATRMGMHDTAGALLSLPVPDSMFQTQFGLLYLYERGQHYLATDRSHSALADFQRCGDLMRAWQTDLTTVVPWRVGAAEAHVTLGNFDVALALAEDQLRRLPPGDARNRGIVLRVMAAASPPDRRARLLQESVHLLDISGDRFEVARSLLELSDAHNTAGSLKEARAVGRHGAQLLAKISGGETTDVAGLMQPAQPSTESRRLPAADAGQAGAAWMLNTLSDAELRVAALAALGHTNREIGNRLYITVSTVEQHLTRVYRKLKVTRRKDLPADLQKYEQTLAEPH